MPGHITKRGQRWRARHPDPSKGGTAQIERTFPTKKEAERWLDELKHSTRSGTFIDPRSRHLFEQAANEYLATLADHAPRTRAGYAAILEGHILPRWGKAKISAITADRIQDWVNNDLSITKAGKQRSPNTVRNITAVLREVLTLAVRRRYIAANPCDAIKLPRKPRGNRSIRSE